MIFYALDKNFNLAADGIPYTNMQWNRKYYEAGDFQAELPLYAYDDSWAYIGTRERSELGEIQKIQYSGEGDTKVLLTGFFCEKMLDDKVCFPEYSANEINVETAFREIFNKYKKDLNITLGAANNPLLGGTTSLEFTDDELGKKLYSILETFELSYRVGFDYKTKKLRLDIWQGKDRTQSQKENAYQVFSTNFGNIANKTVDIDNSGYKNYAIIPIMDDGETVGKDTLYLDWSNGGYKKEIVFDKRSEWPDEYTTDAQFKEQVLQQAAEELLAYSIVEDVDLQLIDDTGYMVDYDLGDKCTCYLSDIGYLADARIVEVREVFKAPDGHTITLGLGNKRINNIRRAVMSR